MKISRIEVTPVSIPLERVVSGSTFTKDVRRTVVVAVETDTGIRGRTYAGDERDQQAELVECLTGELAPEAIGAELLAIERLWERLFAGSTAASDRHVYMHALGALDIAVWDAIGKALDQQLYRLWGGYRESVPVIATGGYYGDDLGLAEEVEAYEQMDLAGIKLKVGGASVEEDLDRLRTVRDVAAEEFVVACDANRGWSAEQAIAFGRVASELDVEWFEEPVVWHDQYRGMAAVRRQTGLPVCAGQNEATPSGCQLLMESDAVDLLNFDASEGGGPTAWRRVAAAASLSGVTMGHHEEPHVAMHLLASVPHGRYVECFHPDIDPVWYRMVENTPTPSDGRIELPDGPGLGLRLDEQ
ncbi:MAG: mandelate racemase/muconate lactonizing enzyme family protein, partial [Halobacteriales archaeon]|nr:mandelate racemase/muconate lactonizing enzyme family protein [Halobacteriales archaeon]